MPSHVLQILSVPVAYMIAISPKTIVMRAAVKSLGRFNNVAPRTVVAEISDPVDKARAQRAEAAQANGFEALTLYSGAAAMCVATQASPWLCNALTLTFLTSRVAYNYAYVEGDTFAKSKRRSAIWLVGFGATVSMFLVAAVQPSAKPRASKLDPERRALMQKLADADRQRLADEKRQQQQQQQQLQSAATNNDSSNDEQSKIK